MESTNPSGVESSMSLDDAASLMDSYDEEPEAAEETEAQDDTGEESEPEEQEADPEEEGEEVEAAYEDGEEWEQDGKKYNVPKALKDSLMLHADYTKKTTEVAEQRKANEAHAKVMSEERNYYANQLNGFIESLNAATQQLPTEAQLLELSKTDPLAYIQARAARDELLVKQYQAQQSADYISKQQQAQDAAQYAEMLKHERNSLMTKLPEWKNEKVAAKERTELAEYLTNEGYDDGDISGLTDSRAVIIARKAMLYDKMIKGTGKQPAQSKPALKILAPGKPNTGQAKPLRELTQRFKQSNSMEDALALLNSRSK